jgi:hypothetical protein
MAAREENEPNEARPAADLLRAVYDEQRCMAGALPQQLLPARRSRPAPRAGSGGETLK